MGLKQSRPRKEKTFKKNNPEQSSPPSLLKRKKNSKLGNASCANFNDHLSRLSSAKICRAANEKEEEEREGVWGLTAEIFFVVCLRQTDHPCCY